MRTVAIVNQKGGCGKTTTAINLAGVLASQGLRTLLVDLDPQAHCAVGLGIPEGKIDLHVGDAMLLSSEQRLDDTRLIWRVLKNLDLIPASMKLAGLEAARGGLAEAQDRDARLASLLARFDGRYDWILIDCPPSIGLLTYNALRAATEALIPVETSFFAMRGADRQVRTIRSLARRLGGKTPFRILATMHDPQSRLARELLAELDNRFGERLVPVVIRLDQRLKEATTFGQPIVEYDATAAGARDYADLARFMIENPADKARPSNRAPLGVDPAQTPEATTALTGTALLPSSAEPASAEESTAGVLPSPGAPRDRASDLAARARQLLIARAAGASAAATCAERPIPEQSIPSDRPPAVPALHRIEETKPTADPDVVRARIASLYGATETSRGVLFVHPGPPGLHVCIAGEFNNWSPYATPLRWNESVRAYEACVEMPAGRCEYRLVINGQWVADPYNRSQTTNPFGDKNSVVVVTKRRITATAAEGAD